MDCKSGGIDNGDYVSHCPRCGSSNIQCSPGY